jgi:serine/threonine protein kinase
VEKEIAFLRAFKSPFIVQLVETFVDGNRIFIVMEYCENGDLSKLMKTYKEQDQLLPETVWFFHFVLLP